MAVLPAASDGQHALTRTPSQPKTLTYLPARLVASRPARRTRQVLRAALGFAGLPRSLSDQALWVLPLWLDSCAGIERVAVGMTRSPAHAVRQALQAPPPKKARGRGHQ